MRSWYWAALSTGVLMACGSEGPTGEMGEPGAMGEMGEPGAMGEPGEMGEPGAMGEMGEPGAMGEVGEPGLACWDLNEDRACDLASEDTDGDGMCGAADCRGPAGDTGPAGDRGPGAGTFTRTIHAMTCIPTGAAPAAEYASCNHGAGTTRTNGSSLVPCVLRPPGEGLFTYVCPLVLPPNAEIDEVRLAGNDASATGYIEGAVWRAGRTSFGPTYISSLGGTWASSGLDEASGAVDLALFPPTDPPHIVLDDSSYTVGIAIGLEPAGTPTNLNIQSVSVTYTIP